MSHCNPGAYPKDGIAEIQYIFAQPNNTVMNDRD